jgi:hypothetical protein
MLGVRLGVVGILAREDVKILTVYVDAASPEIPALATANKPPTTTPA